MPFLIVFIHASTRGSNLKFNSLYGTPRIVMKGNAKLTFKEPIIVPALIVERWNFH